MKKTLLNIDNNIPIFLIHQSYQQRNRLPECIGYITKKFKNLKTGTILRLPTLSPKKAEEFISDCSDYTDLIIVDPELYTHRDDMGLAKSAAANYSFMDRDLPKKMDSEWIEYILDKQREYGATVLLSPSLYVDTVRPQDSLKTQLSWAMEAENFIDDEEIIMVNLTLSHHWLSDENYRSILLNELMDLDSKYFYIRVHWPVMTPRYGQQRNINILEGYRELSINMALEERILILPTTNLTGWISTAFGASGFSVGPSKDQQCFSENLVIKRVPGQPSPQRKNRYFSRPLLHVIDLQSHDALLEVHEYNNCSCIYCDELNAKDPRRPMTWDHEAASLHQIVQAAELTSLLAKRNPRAIAYKEVAKAKKFFQSLKPTIKPTGENNPSHLDIWENLLK